jgi:hypothetical protein
MKLVLSLKNIAIGVLAFIGVATVVLLSLGYHIVGQYQTQVTNKQSAHDVPAEWQDPYYDEQASYNEQVRALSIKVIGHSRSGMMLIEEPESETINVDVKVTNTSLRHISNAIVTCIAWDKVGSETGYQKRDIVYGEPFDNGVAPGSSIYTSFIVAGDATQVDHFSFIINLVTFD